MKDRTKLAIIITTFLAAYFIPFSKMNVQKALLEAFFMLQDYAREHVLFCLVPAFFIAGAIAVFVNQAAVMKYFGAQAKNLREYRFDLKLTPNKAFTLKGEYHYFMLDGASDAWYYPGKASIVRWLEITKIVNHPFVIVFAILAGLVVFILMRKGVLRRRKINIKKRVLEQFDSIRPKLEKWAELRISDLLRAKEG